LVGSTRRVVKLAISDFPQPVGPVMPKVVPVGILNVKSLINNLSSIDNDTFLNSIS